MNNYVLTDLHEQTFKKHDLEFSYAEIEGLEEFANIFIDDIKSINSNGINYKVLSLYQFLTVYEKSKLDGYRINKEEKKDIEKIEIIKKML